ncbi:MAG: NADH-quinone oxidoreductase subunit G, partial [Gammaproteobacteria bacterium]|nr:NADH-quinone oxidoreductase subunit G [Gammaproteobacteria bacterium]
LDNRQADGPVAGAMQGSDLQRIGDVAILSTDSLVRRAQPLQASPDGQVAGLLRISSSTAESAGVREGYRVRVSHGDASVEMDVSVDERVTDGCVWLQSGTTASASLGAAFGPVTMERV